AWRVVDDHTLQLERVYNMAHGAATKQQNIWDPYEWTCNSAGISNALGDPTGTCDYCSALDFYNDRLLFHASEDKHALYPSCRVCEDMTIVELPVIANTLAAIRDSLTGGIIGLIELIIESFSWLDDDHLGDQVLVLTRDELQAVAPSDELGPSGRVDFTGGDFHYSLGWSLDNRAYPHVRLVLTDLYCHDETCDTVRCFRDCPRGWSDEPYVVAVGFSIFPEGVVTWVPEPIPSIGDDVDCGEDDEDFPEIVIFNGEVGEDYIIGFAVSLYEDDGTDTGYGERRGMAEDMAEQLQARLSGATVPGDCGEPPVYRLAEYEVDEDCNGGGIRRFPAYNIGEPLQPWIDSLTSFGFAGEQLGGILCSGDWCDSGGCEWGETCPTGTGFCGGEGCNYRCYPFQRKWEFSCGTSVLEFLSEDPWTFAFDDLATR
ncbi:MAG: hypothetical protein AB1449_07470, partial [Chloroflexota bacterium]